MGRALCRPSGAGDLANTHPGLTPGAIVWRAFGAWECQPPEARIGSRSIARVSIDKVTGSGSGLSAWGGLVAPALPAAQNPKNLNHTAVVATLGSAAPDTSHLHQPGSPVAEVGWVHLRERVRWPPVAAEGARGPPLASRRSIRQRAPRGVQRDGPGDCPAGGTPSVPVGRVRTPNDAS